MTALSLPTEPQDCRGRSVPELRAAAARYYTAAALTEAWGDHLQQFPWQTFETYSFPGYPSRSEADAAMADVHKWIRHKLGHRTEWFQAAELQERGAIHFHVLRLDCQGLKRLSVMDYWYQARRPREFGRNNGGHARVYEYDPALGARYYLCQYVAKGSRGGGLELDCDVSRSLVRHLASGSNYGSSASTLMPAAKVQIQAVR